MSRLARIPVALVLAAWTAFAAAEPRCADEVAGGVPAPAVIDAGGDAHEDCSGECDTGCVSCECCRPPLAALSAHSALAPSPARAGIPATAGARPPGLAAREIFQPPRA